MNMYTVTDLRTEIHWLPHGKLLAFLKSKKIVPAHEVVAGKRTYRLYDEAALIKCRALRKAYDEKRGLTKKPPAPTETTPAYSPQVDALHAAMEHMAEQVAHIRKQLDILVKELGSTANFDDAPEPAPAVGGTD